MNPRTEPPKALQTLTECKTVGEYNPASLMLTRLPHSFGLQTITLLPAVPLYLFSPGLRVYRAEDVITFQGYLSKVEFVDAVDGEEPEATITITPSNDERDQP